MSNSTGRHAFIPDGKGQCIANCRLPRDHEIHQGFPISDPRIPYDPNDEVVRLEVVIDTVGRMKMSLPPVHQEPIFWQMYRYMWDEAKQHYADKKRSPLAL